MTERNILKSIRADEADASELEQLLLNHYGHASQSGRVCTFGPKTGAHGLRLMLSNSWSPIALLTGPAFSDNDELVLAEKVDTQLLRPGPTLVERRVLFTDIPTKGWYQAKDRFQIRAMPKNAPQPAQMLGPHPFLLEVPFVSSPDLMITALRATKATRAVELFLTAILWLGVDSIPSVLRHRWVRPLVGSPDTSIMAQDAYVWPGAEPRAAAFSDVEEMPKMQRLSAQDYYGRIGISLNSQLDIPSSIDSLATAFFELNSSDRERFLRASYWFQHAQRVWRTSHSGAFLALVRAVEALMPTSEPGTPCSECGRPQGVGVRARFDQFVERLAGQPSVAAEDRQQFYRLRSAVDHGGKLLQRDETLWGMSGRHWEEYRDYMRLHHIVNVVLHNWLLTGDPAPA